MRKTAAVLLAVLWLIAACTGCSTLAALGAQGVREAASSPPPSAEPGDAASPTPPPTATPEPITELAPSAEPYPTDTAALVGVYRSEQVEYQGKTLTYTVPEILYDCPGAETINAQLREQWDPQLDYALESAAQYYPFYGHIGYECWVTGGNGSQCHGIPGDTVIQKGDFITMDTGAMLKGYHSDMTRTVALGHVSDEQKAIYDTVLKAQLAAIDAVHAGVRCCDVDKVARDIIETPYPGTFGHGLGHGVGFEIHEWPRFSRLDDTICAPGMVITVEPGIYVAGKCGVRIEDMIVVTEDGCRNLTHSPKELIIL